MRTHLYIIAALVAPAGLCGAPKSDITAPQKRSETIELARTLLTTKPVETTDEEVAGKNPFNRVAPVVEVPAEAAPEAAPVINTSDRDLLLGMVESVTPSGTIRVGGTQYLLFGQKKLKIGDAIPIVFQGTNYELQLTGIERTSFTLRLNKEEITRPIKP